MVKWTRFGTLQNEPYLAEVEKWTKSGIEIETKFGSTDLSSL